MSLWVFGAAFCRTVVELCVKTLKIALVGRFLVLTLAGNAEKIGVKDDLSIIR